MQKIFLALLMLATAESASAPDFSFVMQNVEEVGLYRHADIDTIDNNRQFFSTISAGIRVAEEPFQNRLDPYEWIPKNNYEIGLSDEFKLKGLVISTRDYSESSGDASDARADIAPLDVVIGWNRMSDPAVLQQISVLQAHRFYFWHVNEFPIPRAELELSSTNLHLIPGSSEVAENLKTIRKGQVLELEGYLVDVKDSNGNIWATSRVRNDSGDGACEIMLVNQVHFTE